LLYDEYGDDDDDDNKDVCVKKNDVMLLTFLVFSACSLLGLIFWLAFNSPQKSKNTTTIPGDEPSDDK